MYKESKKQLELPSFPAIRPIQSTRVGAAIDKRKLSCNIYMDQNIAYTG